MRPNHARAHGRHRDLAPALWLAAVVVVLFVCSLVAIALLLHELAAIGLELVSFLWGLEAP